MLWTVNPSFREASFFFLFLFLLLPPLLFLRFFSSFSLTNGDCSVVRSDIFIGSAAKKGEGVSFFLLARKEKKLADRGDD